ncbi:PRC-barrel domain-containing protein [Sulfitobacter aestuarii]|uniref:PRC-barrel domain-containing protein n=1 Tax=Sulfitobacter aestuarii TaxID=2161676 RepID=A0ABW5U3D9_9RHOB
MKRFLSTTAVLLTMTGAAYAETHTEGFGSVQVQQDDFFASDLIGMRIYNSEAEVDAEARIADGAEQEWDDIGEINDIIITPEGDVSAVILGIGGFLGMGERDVSISMDKIKILREEGDSNERFLVVNTSKEMLEQSPEFERPMDASMEQSAENMEAETEQMAENAEAETEQMAENAEAETEEMAQNVETETEEMAQNVETETEEMAENAEAETEELAAEAEANVEGEAVETETMAEDNTVVTTTDRPLLTRPQVEREGYAEAPMEEVQAMTAEDIEGTSVYGVNDESVGEVDTLIMSEDGKVERVVINVGGFLGLGEKPVAVTFDELQILKNAEGDDIRIYIDSTEEALESQPEYQVD